MTKNVKKKPLRDIEIIVKAQKGDQKAFTKLFDTYRVFIFNFIKTIISNKEDAEDVTIDTFTTAFEKINSYTPVYSFSTWLYRIALNKAIDFLRKKQRKFLITEQFIQEVEEYLEKVPDNELSPVDVLITEEQYNKLKSKLSKLNPISCKIIEMRYVENKQFDEIAKELQIKPSTARGQIRRAKTAFYKILQDT